MKKPDKKENINLFFSAFLVVAFVICAHFFNQFTQTLPTVAGAIVSSAVYVVFGLLLFYATRVGDGKAVKRFSPLTLIVMVLPTLYIVIASIASGMPLHDVFVNTDGSYSIIVALAAVALGYGIPYSFLSGFETVDESDEAEEQENAEPEVSKPLKGGIEEDLLDDSDNEEEIDDSAEDTEQNDSEQQTDKASEPLNPEGITDSAE